MKPQKLNLYPIDSKWLKFKRDCPGKLSEAHIDKSYLKANCYVDFKNSKKLLHDYLSFLNTAIKQISRLRQAPTRLRL